jgi:hypothetical protein
MGLQSAQLYNLLPGTGTYLVAPLEVRDRARDGGNERHLPCGPGLHHGVGELGSAAVATQWTDQIELEKATGLTVHLQNFCGFSGNP